ncbi:hypothetical protein CLTEP_11860 [Clostridium tepidiprofundi DSM 19306]|uniref:Uncharacterized protein n=1 Tax=Clostridium tepidiprofundi DSM 19306 TaxID=1121338 RepID=A0A151B4L4_9CLOT|nr:hypothetical protein [Clostridium tepidiprofundi]KYH34864.1 hypothetical protein CLTEP_11860 [Clostridium tepidiprofundi DSM 19306]
MKKNHSTLFLFICFILILIGIFEYINYKNVIITDVSSGPGKAIYDFVKQRDGQSAAEKIKIKNTKKFYDGYGYRFDIYRYTAYTGRNEIIYFFLEKDSNNNWFVSSVQPKYSSKST